MIDHPELLDCGFDTGKPGLEAIEKFGRNFTKTRDEWMELFGSVDCCVEPVLELSEVDQILNTWLVGFFRGQYYPQSH